MRSGLAPAKRLTFCHRTFRYLPDKDVFLIGKAPPSRVRAIPPSRHRPSNELYLQLTDRCNMRCPFCYQRHLEHRPDMSWPVLKRVLEEEMARRPKRARLTIVFFGGEPLLCMKTIERAVRYCNRRTARRQRLSYFVVTNGKAITDAVAKRLRAMDVGVQLSLEGEPEINARLRPGQDVGRIVRTLKKNGIEPWLKLTVSPQNADVFSTVRYCLEELGCGRIGMEICASSDPRFFMDVRHVRRLKREIERCVQWAMRTGRMEQLDFYYFSRPEQYHRSGDVLYPLWRKSERCGAFTSLSAVGVDGKYYSCPVTLGMEAFCIGTAGAGIDNATRRRFRSALEEVRRERCADCPILLRCGGICHAFSALALGDPFAMYPALCEFQKLRIAYGLYLASL